MKEIFGRKGAGAPEGGKLETVMARLKDLAQRRNAAAQGDSSAVGKAAVGRETVADDGKISADKQQVIAASEAVVRPVLKMFGVDYDALIRMDGKSPYALAVDSQPDVLQGVLGAENPVLAALQVATGYQPYAEFSARYGKEPAEIKQNIRAEVLAEDGEEKEPMPAGGLVFSQRYGGGRTAKEVERGGLERVFGK